jgi:hypothetical protein
MMPLSRLCVLVLLFSAVNAGGLLAAGQGPADRVVHLVHEICAAFEDPKMRLGCYDEIREAGQFRSAIEDSASSGPECLLERAVYENPSWWAGQSPAKDWAGYELHFRPDEYGSATRDVFTLSLPDNISLEGQIVWSLGMSRPYASIMYPTVRTAPDSVTCRFVSTSGRQLPLTPWAAEICQRVEGGTLYRNEIYGLRVDSEGRLTTQDPFGPHAAPPTLLLPNLGAQMYRSLNTITEDFRSPGDLFHFKACSQH